MSKICFVGINAVVAELVNSIKGHEVSAISFDRLNLDKSVEFRSVRKSFGWLYTMGKWFNLELTPPLYFKGLENHLDEIKPDIIVTGDFFRMYFYQVLNYARSKNIRVYLYSESKMFPAGDIGKIVFKHFLRRLIENKSKLSGVFVYSKQGKDFFEAQGVKSRILPLPVDANKFKFQKRKFMAQNTIRILMNARMVGYKRHCDLIDAVGKLHKDGVKIQATFLGDGPLYTRIQNLITLKKLPITLIKRIPYEQIEEIYAKHDVLVLPSYNEAIGIVVAEAMSTGMPTITSDSVGGNIYVKSGETGLTYQTGNVDELVSAIKSLMSQKELTRLGNNASKRIKDLFTHSAVNKILSVYLFKSNYQSALDKTEEQLYK